MGEGRLEQPARHLTGRKVLVVGAGTRPDDDPRAPVGNGRAIAVLAARAGADVACADVAAPAAAATAELVGREGRSGITVVGDATEAQQSAAMVAEACADWVGWTHWWSTWGWVSAPGWKARPPKTGTRRSP
ncbi:hypothetical protein GCM10023086_50610 [Streptomyces venetus]|uniref:SDR family NAD(P)-dependent oxidoreductase n=1 Tax=Streptomyces venetus TaxID=1701086 RepID=A0ABP8GHF9_9ACTN